MSLNPKNTKQTILIALGLLAVLAITILAYFKFSKNQDVTKNPAYAQYLEAYTSGIISKKSVIKVQFAGQVIALRTLN
jgi:hypothetical protein